MDLYALFNRVLKGPWTTVGLDLQYRLEGNVLFFQQTASNEDWKNNFDFAEVAYKDSDLKWRVHRGFKRVWKSGRDEILPKILGIKDLTIVGYSHGGPLAGFCHEAYWFHNKAQPRTITFGSPRFVHRPSDPIRGRFCRLINVQASGDLVTHLPPALFGYEHVGLIYEFGNGILPLPSRHMPEHYKSLLSGADL